MERTSPNHHTPLLHKGNKGCQDNLNFNGVPSPALLFSVSPSSSFLTPDDKSGANKDSTQSNQANSANN